MIRPGHYQVNPARPEDFERLLDEGFKADRRRAVVHLWGLDASDPAEVCVSGLHLARSLIRGRERMSKDGPRLYLVTRGAQAVGAGIEPLSIAQAPVWGLARTIQKEHPELRCAAVDIGATDDPEEIRSLLQEILLAGEEDQIALRGSARFVARLVRYSPERSRTSRRDDAETDEGYLVAADHPFRLDLSTPGTLEGLVLRAAPDERPGPGEVKIRVVAAGMNFVDVLRSLGVIPGPPDGGLSLGGDCSGIVVEAGTGVTSFQEGDEVIAVAPGCFGSYAIADASLTIHKPERVSFQEAATIPVAFLTAYYALVRLGRLSEGERVLIHSASGGVGLAAIQIARQIGAEIYATAGSAEKREFLRSLGVEHVMDSRSLSFADEVMRLSGGQGVDVALNSLAGEAIAKGLATLRDYGRFLEIGKRDIAEDNRLGLRPFRKNLSFFAIDLDRMCRERPAFVGDMLADVVRQVREGLFEPLPLQSFSLSDASSAFRAMAQARHVGKIVLSAPDRGEVKVLPHCNKPSLFAPDAAYLITGGTGGLGLTTARWMVRQGARHLALISRHGASGIEAAIDEMRKAGAQVAAIRADVARREEVRRALEEVDNSMPPLKGIIHAAGVLDDGMLAEMDIERFAYVMGPKISGAWNLHLETLDRGLDLFLLFSSAASLLGSPGQANYSAANAFLDALAHHRRASGLPAMSINWGPWAEVGLAARPDRGGRLALHGIGSITPSQGVEILELLLKQNAAQVGVMPVDWRQWKLSYAGAGGSKMISLLLDGSDRGSIEPGRQMSKQGLTAQTLMEAEAGDRERLLQMYLRDKVALGLGLAPSSVELNWPLSKHGLDSLLAVELKHRIEADLGVSVPIIKLLGGADIAQLATFILDQADSTELYTAAPLNLDSYGIPENLSAGLDRLSGPELDSLLKDLLAHGEAD
jgi:NADPH:quinone reductase-like Zn-dependent oxidoreductase